MDEEEQLKIKIAEMIGREITDEELQKFKDSRELPPFCPEYILNLQAGEKIFNDYILKN